MKRLLFALSLLTLVACDEVEVTAPCDSSETITRRGLHADTSLTKCLD